VHTDKENLCVHRIDGLQGSDAESTALKKCKGGDPWSFLMVLVTDEILKWLSSGVNWFINLINGIICSIPFAPCRAIDEVCWTASGPKNVYTCGNAVGRNKLEEQLGCAFGGSDTGRKEAAKCYFERQRSICMSGDGSRYQRYKSLFEAPPMEALEQQFFDIVYAASIRT
jgi:hypothetical protein